MADTLGPQFVCPQCGKKSWHPADADEGYCGMCREFTGLPVAITVGGTVTAVVGWLDRGDTREIRTRLAELLRVVADHLDAEPRFAEIITIEYPGHTTGDEPPP